MISRIWKELSPRMGARTFTKIEFSGIQLNPPTVEKLKQRGFTDLLPIQKAMFGPVYEGKDVLGKDLTGSGKTVSFILPILERMRDKKIFRLPLNRQTPKTLVILPTRELALQTEDEFNNLAIDPSEFNVRMAYGGKGSIKRYFSSRPSSIVIGTPGKLLDFISNSKLYLKDIDTVVMDEAHRLFDISFKEDVTSILHSVHSGKETRVQKVFISATTDPILMEELNSLTESKIQIIDLVGELKDRMPTTIEHLLLRVDGGQSYSIIDKLIKKYYNSSTKCLVFTRMKREVKDLIQKYKDLNPLGLHGDMEQPEREAAYREFKRRTNGILFATDVAARGIDIPKVNTIIQTEPPETTDLYIHRAGRTARAGKSGTVITLCLNKKHQIFINSISKACNFHFKRIAENEI